MNTPPFILQAAAITHPGKLRVNNEDCVAVNNWINQDKMSKTKYFEQIQDRPQCFLVADGLGGHRAGEIASRFVLEQLTTWVITQKKITQELLKNKLKAINSELFELSTEPDYHAMGCTLAGLITDTERLFIFTVGDSLIFRENSGFLTQLLAADSPTVAYGDAENGDNHGIVTQCFGGTSQLENIYPHIKELQIIPDRLYLLTTDGLTSALPMEDIESLLDEDLPQAALNILHSALAAGASDNLAFILLRAV